MGYPASGPQLSGSTSMCEVEDTVKSVICAFSYNESGGDISECGSISYVWRTASKKINIES